MTRVRRRRLGPRAPAPTQEQLAAVVESVATPVRRLLGKPDPDPEPITQAPVLKVFGAEPSESAAPSLAAECDAFNLHADVAFESHERVAVERLCRYMLRGPLALGRLSQGRGGHLVYRLKAPKPDGTTHLVLSPMALLQRLIDCEHGGAHIVGDSREHGAAGGSRGFPRTGRWMLSTRDLRRSADRRRTTLR